MTGGPFLRLSHSTVVMLDGGPMLVVKDLRLHAAQKIAVVTAPVMMGCAYVKLDTKDQDVASRKISLS